MNKDDGSRKTSWDSDESESETQRTNQDKGMRDSEPDMDPEDRDM